MGKKSSDAPDPVDPAVTIGAQSAANKEAIQETARLNAIPRYTPYGNVTYEYGDDGLPTAQFTALNPTSQQIYEKQQGLVNALADQASIRAGQIPQDQFSLGGLPAVRSDFSDDARRVEDATFNSIQRLLQPQYEQERRALEQNLADRGLPFQGEAHTTAFDNFDRRKDEAYRQAADAAVQAGRAEQSRLYGLESDTRSRALNERLMERTQPFNELAAFLQGAPALPSQPIGGNTGYNVAPVDAIGAYGLYGQQQAQQAAARSQQNAANLSGLYGLGSALGSAWIGG